MDGLGVILGIILIMMCLGKGCQVTKDCSLSTDNKQICAYYIESVGKHDNSKISEN